MEQGGRSQRTRSMGKIGRAEASHHSIPLLKFPVDAGFENRTCAPPAEPAKRMCPFSEQSGRGCPDGLNPSPTLPPEVRGGQGIQPM